MTIAFFNSIPTWGGGEKWHFETSVYFAEKGYDVYFYANPNGVLAKKLKDFPAVKVIPVSLGNLSFINPVKILKLKNSFSKFKIDLLIINHPGDLKIAAHAANLAGVKRIIYRRGSAIAIKNRVLNRYIFKNWVTDILANSNETKNTILEKNPNLFPINKIKVIYNHIDIQEFLERPYDELIISNSNNKLILGSLGRLAPQKNQFFLIDLSKALKEQNIDHLIYIGGIGNLESELKAYSKSQNTEDTVLFLGFQKNVKTFLNAIDIFILPSLWEGFGYVLAEASLCQKPIIAFDLSSNPEVVVKDKSGFLVKKNDITETIEKIKKLQDEKLRSSMGEIGFEYCRTTFDRNKIMSQIENYLNHN